MSSKKRASAKLREIKVEKIARFFFIAPGECSYSSANSCFALDPVPQRLKPDFFSGFAAGLKACSTSEGLLK